MTTADRRAALLAARTVNGVDFVEIDPADETTLVVHFILNLPGSPSAEYPVPADPGLALSAGNFLISGGERITGIGVVSAEPRPGTYDQMNVVADQVGDFSVYTLTVQDGSIPPSAPPGFDPASASANFSFHIDCAGDFDCLPQVDCLPLVVPPPRINYLARDYPGFLRVMLDRMSLLTPDWQERNPADLGVAVIEMLAYVADQLSYRLDAIGTEAYLGTARLRTSVRRHARLVDYAIGEGANARAWLRVLLAAGAADGSVLPAATRCATRFPGAAAPLLAHESLAYAQAITAGAVFFETRQDSPPLSAALAQMPLYAWSDKQACLAPGATHATLTGSFTALVPGMVLVLAEVIGPVTADPADANPQNRQAVRLTSVIVTEDPVSAQPVTEIDWAAEDGLTFPLCVSSEAAVTAGAGSVSVAWGNIVLSDQGRSIGTASDPTSTGPEPIGTVPPPGEGWFRPSLALAPLTFAFPAPAAGQPAIAAVSPAGTPAPVVSLTSVDIDGNAQSWSASPDLLDAGIGPATTVFVPEIETAGVAYLLFGDGTNGLRPQPGTTFAATYRTGNGTAGNVARETITLIDLPADLLSVVTGVTNPLPAQGGTDSETANHVRQCAPVAFQTQLRAVTAADYQAFASAYPGVRRASATLRWTGSWHTVFITVERDQQAALDPAFISGLEAYLDGYRMAGVDLEVQDGTQVPLLIQMSVCAAPGYVAADVEQALLSVFNASLQPDGAQGLFNPDRLDLGQPFYLSPLIAAAQAIDGVTSVQVLTFQRQDQPGSAGLLAGVLVPQPLEFFVLDNDPSYPERGRFELTVTGGL